MNVASRELCEELFKLSQWGASARYIKTKGGLIAATSLQPLEEDEFVCPAYEISYLYRVMNKPSELSGFSSFWKASSSGHEVEAENPEDAMVKLAVALFKAGVLTR
jgi:hypothetical protein